jgi:UDP-glucose 4-epimerase
MKVGVTGGMGFIGGYVVEELLERGHEPVVMDRQSQPLQEAMWVPTFFGDVRDEVAMCEFAAHVEGMIHLAAVLGTQETVQNPRPAARSNLEGGLNFLEACTQYQIPGVYIAVGNWWMNNPYSITKNMIERFAAMYNADRNGRFNVVRAVNAYGPRQLAAAPFGPGKVRKITPALVCRALSGMPMELYGGGHQVSDMVHVKDVAKALVTSLEYANNNVILDKAVEVGSHRPVTVRHVANLINTLVPNSVPIVDLPMRPGEKEGDVVKADFTTLSQIDMDPQDLIGLDTGMHETVEWFRANEGTHWKKP